MSLARWLRLHETGSRAARALGAIVLVQGALAGLALAIDLLELCGACGGGDRIHAAIAGTGVLAYALLYVLLRGRAWTGVFFGIFAAAGVHLSLLGLMLARGGLCGVCLVAAILSLVGPAILLFRDRSTAAWLARATVPSFLMAGLAAWTTFGVRDARAAALRVEASRGAAALSERTPAAPEIASARGDSILHVIEQERCPYCLEFKKSYAPRLERDFPGLSIQYHPMAEAPWARRAPSFVLAGELLFEGLPLEYGDLVQAISDARRVQETPGR